MKRWLILLLTLTLSWNSFSQTVTETKDTTHIVLSTTVARQVAIDLVEGDRAREEAIILLEKTEVLESLIAIQDTMITYQNQEIEKIQKVRELENILLNQQYQEADRLGKELKKQLRYKTTFQITTGLAAVALIVSLLVN